MPLYQVNEGQTLTIEGPATVIIRSTLNDPVITGGNTPPPEPEVPPTLTSLVPNQAVANDPTDIVMHCHGTGFTDQSVIVFNGHDEPTTLVSDTEVTTGVKPSLFEVPAECPVLIRTGSQQTEPQTFSFVEQTAARSRR